MLNQTLNLSFFLQLKGVAKYADGSIAENDIDLKITVVDENDCPPIIKVEQVGSVKEASAAGIVRHQYLSRGKVHLRQCVSCMLVISRYRCDESDRY